MSVDEIKKINILVIIRHVVGLSTWISEVTGFAKVFGEKQHLVFNCCGFKRSGVYNCELAVNANDTATRGTILYCNFGS